MCVYNSISIVSMIPATNLRVIENSCFLQRRRYERDLRTIITGILSTSLQSIRVVSGRNDKTDAEQLQLNLKGLSLSRCISTQ